ncbi:MAG: gliding motility-associated C-terminal domain-containing protein, partial [Flavobacteriales bacterium]
SMFLQVLPYEECDDHVDISWTPYFSWNTPPSYYIIHRALSLDNQYSNDTYVPIDTVNGTNVLNFADFQYLPGGWNFYRVEAVDTLLNHRAFSNIRGVEINEEIPPAFVRITSVNVTSEKTIEVQVTMSPTSSTFRYVLQRFDDEMLEWDEVMTYDAQNVGSIRFEDVDLVTDVFAYTYRVMVFNRCGVLKDTTYSAKSILLNGLASQELLANTLIWTGFHYWPEGIQGYDVIRRVGRLGSEDFIIEILPGADLRFEDDLSDFIDTNGEFCYRIDATMATADGTEYSSKSNEICLALEPVIWVPTAMMIGGNNDEFFPVISYADLSNYHLVVYSRWGDIMFETDNIEEHWDGTYNGKVVPNDVYMYALTVDDGRGQAIQRNGTLTVLVY